MNSDQSQDSGGGQTPKVLIVEDDPDLLSLLTLHLSNAGYATDVASNGEEGLKKVFQPDISLIILDIMLPGLNGREICRKIREQNNSVPILMLTAMSGEADTILGLELGADDYMTKPFRIGELMARVRALLRRSIASSEQSDDITGGTEEMLLGPLRIRPDQHRTWLNGEEIELRHKEFELLLFLAKQPGKVFSRNDLLEKVWGYDFDGYGHTVTSHINRLRSKLDGKGAHPDLIQTVRGAGYRFIDPEELTSGNDAN